MLGINVLYLPPYSCDFNAPAEEFFRDLKKNLKRQRYMYRAAPDATILQTVTAMSDYDISPIVERIGYSSYCRYD